MKIVYLVSSLFSVTSNCFTLCGFAGLLSVQVPWEGAAPYHGESRVQVHGCAQNWGIHAAHHRHQLRKHQYCGGPLGRTGWQRLQQHPRKGYPGKTKLYNMSQQRNIQH